MTIPSMDEFFGPEGLLNKRFSSFEYRKEQQDLAEEVHKLCPSPAGREFHPCGRGAAGSRQDRFRELLVPAMFGAAETGETVLSSRPAFPCRSS